jgi:outer membrane lipoprotein SlyB
VAGSTASLSGKEIGVGVDIFGGPAGMALSGLAGAVLGGLLGAAIGCSAGEEAGQVFDGRLMNIYACEACGYKFNQ